MVKQLVLGWDYPSLSLLLLTCCSVTFTTFSMVWVPPVSLLVRRGKQSACLRCEQSGSSQFPTVECSQLSFPKCVSQSRDWMGGHENSATVKDFWRPKTQNQVCNASMQHAGTCLHCVSWRHQSLASKHTTHKSNNATSNILAKDLRLWCIIHWVVFTIQVLSSYTNIVIQLEQRLNISLT